MVYAIEVALEDVRTFVLEIDWLAEVPFQPLRLTYCLPKSRALGQDASVDREALLFVWLADNDIESWSRSNLIGMPVSLPAYKDCLV